MVVHIEVPFFLPSNWPDGAQRSHLQDFTKGVAKFSAVPQDIAQVVQKHVFISTLW